MKNLIVVLIAVFTIMSCSSSKIAIKNEKLDRFKTLNHYEQQLELNILSSHNMKEGEALPLIKHGMESLLTNTRTSALRALAKYLNWEKAIDFMLSCKIKEFKFNKIQYWDSTTYELNPHNFWDKHQGKVPWTTVYKWTKDRKMENLFAKISGHKIKNIYEFLTAKIDDGARFGYFITSQKDLKKKRNGGFKLSNVFVATASGDVIFYNSLELPLQKKELIHIILNF